MMPSGPSSVQMMQGGPSSVQLSQGGPSSVQMMPGGPSSVQMVQCGPLSVQLSQGGPSSVQSYNIQSVQDPGSVGAQQSQAATQGPSSHYTNQITETDPIATAKSLILKDFRKILQVIFLKFLNIYYK